MPYSCSTSYLWPRNLLGQAQKTIMTRRLFMVPNIYIWANFWAPVTATSLQYASPVQPSQLWEESPPKTHWAEKKDLHSSSDKVRQATPRFPSFYGYQYCLHNRTKHPGFSQVLDPKSLQWALLLFGLSHDLLSREENPSGNVQPLLHRISNYLEDITSWLWKGSYHQLDSQSLLLTHLCLFYPVLLHTPQQSMASADFPFKLWHNLTALGHMQIFALLVASQYNLIFILYSTPNS